MFLFILSSIFFISLACLLAMIFYRSWELKTGKVLAANEVRLKTISSFRLDEFLYLFLRVYKKIAEKLLSLLLEYGRETIHNLEELLQKIPQPSFMQKLIDFVRGKNILGIKKGSVKTSAFIQEIVQHKENIKNGGV